jgi:hypothetical protein
MIIKRFILTVACKDTNNVDVRAVEESVNHGLLDSSAFSATLADEREVDFPDPDLSPDSFPTNNDYYKAMDKAEEAWTKRAEDEVFK